MALATSTPAPTSRRDRTPSGYPSAAAGGSSASKTSPTCLSRIQEKDELRHLNDRLAIYIQRAQELESERSLMLQRLEETDESKTRQISNMRRLYEEELADVRKSLDDLAAEKAKIQTEYQNLRLKNENLQTRNQETEGDLANVFSQQRKVEAMLNSKDHEYIKLLSENQRLSHDTNDLQNHLEKVKKVLTDTKNQLGSEIMRRVDLENGVQTFKEQLKLQRNIDEQEMVEIRRRHENLFVEVESGQQREFENKVAQAMQQLRQDQESQLQEYKEELENAFCSKLQNAELVALEKNHVASATKDELESMKLRVETLSSQLHQCQKKKMLEEARFQELERILDRERGDWQQRVSQKEHELLNLRNQVNSQLEDYENLLDVKLALDMEINAYKKMLEVEEERLHVSPTASQQHPAVPYTHERIWHGVRGKKRWCEDTSSSSPAYKMSTKSEDGPVNVAEIHMDGKYVKLKNNMDTVQPLGGWVVQRICTEPGDISFQIPSSCVLEGGQTLTVFWSTPRGQTAPVVSGLKGSFSRRHVSAPSTDVQQDLDQGS
ncbi:lamin-B3-like [Anableps anableps]